MTFFEQNIAHKSSFKRDRNFVPDEMSKNKNCSILNIVLVSPPFPLEFKTFFVRQSILCVNKYFQPHIILTRNLGNIYYIEHITYHIQYKSNVGLNWLIIFSSLVDKSKMLNVVFIICNGKVNAITDNYLLTMHVF